MKLGHKILIITGIIILIVLAVRETSNFQRTSFEKRNLSPVSPASEEMSAAEGESTEIFTETEKSSENLDSSRIVVKTGTLNLVVKDIGKTVQEIVNYSEDKGGWILQSDITKINKVPTGKIIVRVPQEDFEETMDYFASLAVDVEYEGREGEDVTEEYIDLQARLRNLQATEDQLLSIMEKTTKISDVLDVQREITKIRGQIEKIQGQLKYIQRLSKMGTITVNLALSEELLPVPASERWKPKYVAKRAWENVVAFWKGISYVFINLLIYSLIVVPFVVFIWLVYLVKNKKIANKREKTKN